ncbi:Y-family DNA polymerase [Spongorhabdus nitratireducens]
MKQVIALCDANSFYCSCEQVFDPGLRNKPLGVLSNNDGCIIARTRELKALGIAMGTPAFKVRQQVERGQILLRSSNYALYGDMSSRFMSVLEQFSPGVEVYSIDEAFVDLSGFPLEQLEQIGNKMKQRVMQWTGLPIGVGIATTKTLAKLANHAAKQFAATGGVVDLTDPARQLRLMKIMPVEEVWGVGRNIGKRLRKHNILSAADLVACNHHWIRKQFSVVLERTVCELQGESCIPWEETGTGNKHEIMCSRSFGQRVHTKRELHAALVSFVSRACEKLRRQQKLAREAILFIRTDPFRNDTAQYNRSIRLALPNPTNDTRPWLRLLVPALNTLYRQGFEYKKAGFVLLDLCTETSLQNDLIQPPAVIKPDLMPVIDSINQRFGRHTIRPAAMGFQPQSWHMNQQHCSPHYTTCWNDIMKVYAIK